MITLTIFYVLLLANMGNVIIEDGLDFYKDIKFWLSLVSTMVLSGLLVYSHLS